MTVYQTRTGLKIGLLYRPPAPHHDADATLVQRAMLDRRTRKPRPALLRLLGVVCRWL